MLNHLMCSAAGAALLLCAAPGPVLAQTPQINTATCKEKTVLLRIRGDLLRDMVAKNGRPSTRPAGWRRRRSRRGTEPPTNERRTRIDPWCSP